MEACHRFTEGFNAGTCSWMWRFKGAKPHPFFSTQVPKFCSAFMSGSQMTPRCVDQGVIRVCLCQTSWGCGWEWLDPIICCLSCSSFDFSIKIKQCYICVVAVKPPFFPPFEKLLAASMRSEEDQSYPSVCLFAESSSLFTFTVCRVTVNVVRVFPLSLLKDELWDMKPEPRLVRISSNLHVCFLSRACSLVHPPTPPSSFSANRQEMQPGEAQWNRLLLSEARSPL